MPATNAIRPGDGKKHAFLVHEGETIAVGSTTNDLPKLIASRDDRDRPTVEELLELLHALGGPGSYVVSRSNEGRIRQAHASIGGGALSEHLPLRLYRHPRSLREQFEVDPEVRAGTSDDIDVITDTIHSFAEQTGLHAPDDPSREAERAVERGGIRILDTEDGIVAVAQIGSAPAAGQVRVGLVYVPEHQRRQGYAKKIVASLTAEAHAMDAIPCLFTDAKNAGTDALYQSLGYEPVEELVHLEQASA